MRGALKLQYIWKHDRSHSKRFSGELPSNPFALEPLPGQLQSYDFFCCKFRKEDLLSLAPANDTLMDIYLVLSNWLHLEMGVATHESRPREKDCRYLDIAKLLGEYAYVHLTATIIHRQKSSLATILGRQSGPECDEIVLLWSAWNNDSQSR